MVGFQKNLLKVWDIMHRIYRNTVAPCVGNFDQIHGKLIDLLFESSIMVGQGKILDVMDIIWHEMYAVVGDYSQELGVSLKSQESSKGLNTTSNKSSTTSATVLVELGEDHHGREVTRAATQVQAHREV